eukprot:GFUD01044899.1.p1 GENE.GFUD01044899.1~~GFUD01044899.1.p1  ORF type:complete len:283 (+),score=89.35 GFUD01044899.1:55-903(+)
MAGKTGEAALQEKLEQIRLDYLSLVEKVKSENVKAAADLEKKFLKDEEEFKARQERERREFEFRLSREREEFRQKQKREKSISDREASERLKQAEDFIDNVKSPSGNDRPRIAPINIGNELECPVCFTEMKPPVHIWQCAQGHPVCQPCKSRPEVRHCPTCRQRIVGRATLVEKIAAQIFSTKDKSGSTEESATHPDTSPDTSPTSSPEPSFRPRLPTYFLSLRQGTRIGNEDFSLNSLREARGVEEFFSTSPQRVLADSDSDTREFDLGMDTHPASFGFLD